MIKMSDPELPAVCCSFGLILGLTVRCEESMDDELSLMA
jgi:hypothetical protein